MTDGEFKMNFTALQRVVKKAETAFQDESSQENLNEDLLDYFFYLISECLDKCLPKFADMSNNQVEQTDLEGLYWRISELINKRIDSDFSVELGLAMFRLDAVLSNCGIDVDEDVLKRGRPKENFRDCINRRKVKTEGDAGRVIDNIRTELKDKTGKDAAKVIAAAMELDYIRRPSYAQVNSEFGQVIANRAQYNEYIPVREVERREDIFANEFIEPIKLRLMI